MSADEKLDPVAWRWRYVHLDGRASAWSPCSSQSVAPLSSLGSEVQIEPLVPASALEASDAKIAALTAERDGLLEATNEQASTIDSLEDRVTALTVENATLREKVERAAEDERDRLFLLACQPLAAGGLPIGADPFLWMRRNGMMTPAERAALRQEGKP